MRKFFKKKTVIAVIIILIVVLVASSLSIIGGAKKANPLTNAVGVVFTPIETLFSATKDATGTFFTALFHCMKYQKENEILSTQIDKLEQDIADMSGLEAENGRLLSLLDLKNSQGDLNTVACRVISRKHSNWYQTFSVNKGSADGIEVNAPVIAVGGLVGYVSEVGTNWAKVVTIFDENCSVSAVVNRTGDQGIAEGSYALSEKKQIQFTFLSDDAGIQKGDYVETSGMGGVYPAGIMIGKVLNVTRDEENLSISANVEPSVAFDRLQEVLIITK